MPYIMLNPKGGEKKKKFCFYPLRAHIQSRMRVNAV